MAVPYTFGTATSSIPLSQLDSNFATAITLGSTNVYLGNTTTTLVGFANLSSTLITSPTHNSGTTLSLQTGGTTGLYIDASQNVGIGTTSPGAKLDVTNSIQIQYTGSAQFGAAPLILKNNVSTANQQQVRLFNQVTDAGNTYGAFGITQCNNLGVFVQTLASYQMNGDYWVFLTANSERMRIDSSGNLLVGKSSASGTTAGNQLGLVGLGYNESVSTNAGGTLALWYMNRQSSAGSIIDFRQALNTVGSITVTASATAYNTSSDYRLKNSVEPMTFGLATVAALKPVTYKWNADNSDGEGFIAHELQAVIPHAVTGEKDAVDANGKPQYQGVDYSKIVVHLVAAIQELSAKVTALESR